MAKTFQVHILAADRPFYVGPCESVILPTVDGQYGILALILMGFKFAGGQLATAGAADPDYDPLEDDDE